MLLIIIALLFLIGLVVSYSRFVDFFKIHPIRDYFEIAFCLITSIVASGSEEIHVFL